MPLVSRMRLTAIAAADGCRKSTVSCGATLKLFQLSDRWWLDCRMVVVAPDCVMLPVPETSDAPTGAAWPVAAYNGSDSDSATSLRIDALPRPLADSATAIQVFSSSLQIRR